MLQNITFQDNLYQMARSIDTVFEGLQLDLTPEYFHKKTMSDLAFFDACIRRIHADLQKNNRLADYLPLMQAMHSCQQKLLQLLDRILGGEIPSADAFAANLADLQEMRNRHAKLAGETQESIVRTEKPGDSKDIVSSSELSELLNFQ